MVHSNAEGGPLILPPLLLLIMLAMMKFVSLFGQQYTLICSHPRPLQRIFFPYVGLDAHITCMRFRPACSRSRKKARGCAVPSLFSSEAPCQASFRPLPSGLQVWVLYIGKQTVRIYRPSN